MPRGQKQREEYESTFLEYAEVLIGGVPMSQRSNKSNGVNVNALRATLGEPSPSELLKRQRSVSGAVDKIHYDGPAESELPPPPSVRGLGSPKRAADAAGRALAAAEEEAEEVAAGLVRGVVRPRRPPGRLRRVPSARSSRRRRLRRR